MLNGTSNALPPNTQGRRLTRRTWGWGETMNDLRVPAATVQDANDVMRQAAEMVEKMTKEIEAWRHLVSLVARAFSEHNVEIHVYPDGSTSVVSLETWQSNADAEDAVKQLAAIAKGTIIRTT